MIFLVFSVTFMLGIPGLGAHNALASYKPEPTKTQLVFYEIKPKLNVVQNPILPELPKVEVAKAPARTKVVTVAKVAPSKAVSVDGKTYVLTATSYSSTPDQTDSNPFSSADGTHVYFGMVACNFLPFGTRVMFPDYFGNKVFVVHDRMARRFSNRVDIWFPDRATAHQFGKRTIKMVVL